MKKIEKKIKEQKITVNYWSYKLKTTRRARCSYARSDYCGGPTRECLFLTHASLLLPPAHRYFPRGLRPGGFHGLAFYAHADARGCKGFRVLSFNFEYDFRHTFVC